MSTPANTDIAIREGTAADVPYCAATWRESFWRSTLAGGTALGEHYFRIWPGLIDLLLTRSRTRTLIATDPADPSLIVGWVAYQPEDRLLHYVYVRGRTGVSPGLQRAGVATALFGALLAGSDLGEWTATHQTAASRKILEVRMAEGGSIPGYVPLLNMEVLR